MKLMSDRIPKIAKKNEELEAEVKRLREENEKVRAEEKANERCSIS